MYSNLPIFNNQEVSSFRYFGHWKFGYYLVIGAWNLEIEISFPNLKEGLTARIKIPPKIQKMAAR